MKSVRKTVFDILEKNGGALAYYKLCEELRESGCLGFGVDGSSVIASMVTEKLIDYDPVDYVVRPLTKKQKMAFKLEPHDVLDRVESLQISLESLVEFIEPKEADALTYLKAAAGLLKLAKDELNKGMTE